MQKYVVGFMFDENYDNVALIRKNRPHWMAGKLNGIGGKIEEGELPEVAMIREFKEETGLETWCFEWQHFLKTNGKENTDHSAFEIDFYVSIGDLSKLKTMEDEVVEITSVDSITLRRKDIVENLAWIIGLAIDCNTDGRPSSATVTY